MGNVTTTASGNVASFMSPYEVPIRSMKVHFSPMQEGQGDPSPSNIRPINGWNGVNVYHDKKTVIWNNLIEGYFSSDFWKDRNSSESTTTFEDGIATVQFLNTIGTYHTMVTKDTHYTYNGHKYYYHFQCMLNKIISGGVGTDAADVATYPTMKVQTDEWGEYSAIVTGRQDRNSNFYVPLLGNYQGIPEGVIAKVKNAILIDLTKMYGAGNEPTRDAFEAECALNGIDLNSTFHVNYAGTEIPWKTLDTVEIPVSWESEIGTIYGGYVDLLKGELIEEWKEADLGSLNWSKFYNYNVYSAKITDMASAMKTQTVMAENYKFYSATGGVVTMPDKSIKNHDSNNSVYVMDTDYTTSSDVSAFKTAMTGIKIIYKLATPITYQLTPQQLNTFKGNNAIWSDADGITEVEYDFTETADIRQVRKRMMLNTPHVEESNGSIVNFNTDISTNLKECKLYFTPKQEGSGTPSPDNIRPIIGINEITIYHGGKNLAHIVGYSASNITTPTHPKKLTNNYGTTIDTVDFNHPDSAVVITQTDALGNTVYDFSNGYIVVIDDNLQFNKTYNVSFRVVDIISNPLNARLDQLRITSPSGSLNVVSSVVGDRVIFKNVDYGHHPTELTRHGIEIRICGMSFTLSEFMVTAADDNDITFEPYQTISEIPITFPIIGKNLFDPNCEMFNGTAYMINSDGSITQTGSDGRGWVDDTQFPPYQLKAGTYTLSFTGGGNINLRTSIDGYTENSTSTKGFLTFTLSEDCGVKFKFSNMTFPVTYNVQIESGSTATTYEPYTTTVYGGYVDVLKGELVAEWEVASGLWGDIKSGSPNNTTGFYQGVLRISRRIKGCHIQSEYGTNVICNIIGTVMWEGAGASPEHFFSGNDDSQGIFYIYCNYDDNQEIQVAAKLETPIIYQLTPYQIKTLKGINNIWSDTDTTNIHYWTHK